MKRRRLTKKQKAELFLKHNGQCASCGVKLQPDEVEWDHIKERRMAVDETDAAAREQLSNFQPLCEACHGAKTAEWSGIHAKAERQGGRGGSQYRRRQAGKTQTIASRGFQTNKNAPFKKRMDGSVVRRDR